MGYVGRASKNVTDCQLCFRHISVSGSNDLEAMCACFQRACSIDANTPEKKFSSCLTPLEI